MDLHISHPPQAPESKWEVKTLAGGELTILEPERHVGFKGKQSGDSIEATFTKEELQGGVEITGRLVSNDTIDGTFTMTSSQDKIIRGTFRLVKCE
jgi:hypothetical protein